MAIIQVERRICDVCDEEAHAAPCLLCRKDFCYAHGDRYGVGNWEAKRPGFDLCDECANDLAAKLSASLKEPENG